jgi:hypothetical protein
MKDIWEFIKKKLINAQQSQKRHADHKRDISSKYKKEHMIWLSIKNIKRCKEVEEAAPGGEGLEWELDQFLRKRMKGPATRKEKKNNSHSRPSPPERSFRKLNHKWIESYKAKKVLRSVCQLNLSSSMKIHDTFHISLLRSTSSDSLIEQIQSSSFSIVINEEKEYEVNDILNSRFHYDKLQYKVV